MTARWVVEEVMPQRDLQVTWQPISLLMKNQPAPDSKWYLKYRFTHNLLRVMESVRGSDGNDGVFALYWEVGTRIHHDKDFTFGPGDALEAADLDRHHAEAFASEGWDRTIADRMDVGLALAGNDIGTPIIGFEDVAGDRVGIFGPVITRVLHGDEALQLWDGMVAVMTVPGFWELKRTRTEPPDMGERPKKAL